MSENIRICAGQFLQKHFIDIEVLSDLWTPGVRGTPKLGVPPVVTSAGRPHLTSPHLSPPPRLHPRLPCRPPRTAAPRSGGSAKAAPARAIVVGIKLSLQHCSD